MCNIKKKKNHTEQKLVECVGPVDWGGSDFRNQSLYKNTNNVGRYVLKYTFFTFSISLNHFLIRSI